MKPQWSNTFISWNELDLGVYFFRIFGFGLWLGRYSKSPPLFSERYGYEKSWRISKDWRIRLLVPRP